jgi:2-C-methyl-D-erythritol 2,4-cyclodiphosphate synthase
MQQRIAEDLATIVENVSIKATTTEKLGFVGRQEGIEAHAVVCLVPKENWQD